MLRKLVWAVQRSLTLSPIIPKQSTTIRLPYRYLYHKEGSVLKPQHNPDGDEEPQFGLDLNSEADADYIVPYNAEREHRVSLHQIVDVLKTRYRLSQTDINKIMDDDVVHRKYKEQSLITNMDTLSLAGFNKNSFLAYPWLLTLDNARLKKKIHLIESMTIKDINHFAPFLRLSLTRIAKLVTSLNSERNEIPLGNRLYYISKELNTHPTIIAKYLAKRLFILEMPFDMLDKNLKLMIDYNVRPMSVLKDLWAFRYTPKSVQLRFERAKRAKKNKIMPWMVRCPESILQKSLKLTLDEKRVLGDKSILEYVADRLQFSLMETKAIMSKHPQVNTVRVTKIKEVLDYLLDEVEFTRFDIAQNPRILCHSLKTTRQRIEQLKTLGCRPSSLVIVCRSKTEYEKFLNNWLAIKAKCKKKIDPKETISHTST